MDVFAYEGSPDDPFPPCGDGWAAVTVDDTQAVSTCGMLAPVLPCWTYTDGMVGGEVYRFFSFKTAGAREHVGALRFVGKNGERNVDPSTLGDIVPPPPPDLPPPPDPGLLDPGGVPGELQPGGPGVGRKKGDQQCVDYVSDASDPTAVAIANEILDQGTAQGKPVPWNPGGGYYLVLADGTRWLFTMQQGAACAPYTKCVWAWRCESRNAGGGGGGGGNPPAGASASMAGWLVMAGLIIVGGVAGVAAITKHSRRPMRRAA